MAHRPKAIDVALQALLLGPEGIGQGQPARVPLPFRPNLPIQAFQRQLAAQVLQAPSRRRLTRERLELMRGGWQIDRGAIAPDRQPRSPTFGLRRRCPEVARAVGAQNGTRVVKLAAGEASHERLVYIIELTLAVGLKALRAHRGDLVQRGRKTPRRDGGTVLGVDVPIARNVAIADMDEGEPAAPLGHRKIGKSRPPIWDVEDDRLRPSRRLARGPIVEQDVLLLGPPPGAQPRLDLRVVALRHGVDVAHQPHPGEDPWGTVRTRTPAVVVGKRREGVHPNPALGQVTKLTVGILQHDRPGLWFARAEELAEDIGALGGQQVRAELVKEDVVWGEDQIVRHPQLLRRAERRLLARVHLQGQIPVGIGRVGVAHIGTRHPVPEAVEPPVPHLREVGGHLAGPHRLVRVAEVPGAVGFTNGQLHGASNPAHSFHGGLTASCSAKR